MTTTVPPYKAPGVGSIVHLANYLIRNKVMAEKTMPDTPDMFTSELEIMGDQGDMNLDPLRGSDGRNGQVTFAFRRQDHPVYTDPSQLQPLKNAPSDIGKYWLFDEVDEQGTVVAQFMYAWYGTSYRKMMMGTYGAPGAVPDIQPHVQLIDPSEKSFIKTGGPTYRPSWEFNLAVPAGIPGLPGPVASMPDVDLSTPPVPSNILVATKRFTGAGATIFAPYSIQALNPQTFSMPQSSFVPYTGVDQVAAIGQFILPPQPFRWTPVVWGHLGAGGIHLSARPLMIGAEVKLGHPTKGIQISRGMGNTLGEVNIMPHYSTAKYPNQVIAPTNDYAVVEANHTNPAHGTVYINLNNDGQLGAYTFAPVGAQLFIMIMPIEAYIPPTRRKKRR
jgi:hypothetical protein